VQRSRIGLEAHFFGGHRGGLRTYTECLAAGLLRRGLPLDIFVRSPVNSPAGRVVSVPGILPGAAGRLVRDHLTLPYALRRAHLDLLHVPAGGVVGYSGRLVVTIHDTFTLHPPAPDTPFLLRAWLRYQAYLLRQVSRRAWAVIVDSTYVKDQVMRDLALPADRVTVIPLGWREVFGLVDPADENRRAAHGLAPRYVVALAANDPRKNAGTAVIALSRLRAAGHDANLVVVCSEANAYRTVGALAVAAGVGPHVQLLRAPDDETLRAVYGGATALWFPSRDEGFGLPPLEAMAAGCPVIAANTGALPETLADGALYCAPDDVDGFVAATARLLEHAGEAERRREAGRRRAALLTWDRCAAETVEVYEKVLAMRAAPARGRS
jgi:glycosyltransferase involved in cell wall biosynthesis